MNIEAIKESLKAQGLSDIIIASMLKSMHKPVKEKSTKRWFPGAVSKKVEAVVAVTSTCTCCGTIKEENVITVVLKGSALTQRVSTMLCENCPSVLRTMTKDQLITILLMKNHPAPDINRIQMSRMRKLAKTTTPEEVLNSLINKNMEAKHEHA